MKTRKIILFFIIVIMVSMSVAMTALLSPTITASAEDTEYYYIKEGYEVFFYTKEGIEPHKALFQIPPTYYSKKIKNGGGQESEAGFYFTEYKGMTGYLKMTEMIKGTETLRIFNNIENPYFTNDPTDTLKNAKPNTDIKSEPKSEASTLKTLLPNEKLEFIGYINAQQIEPQRPVWYYVKFTATDGSLQEGYVYAKNTTIPDLIIKNHPLKDLEDGVNGGSEPKDPANRNNLLETLLAIGIAIPAIILVILIFKPRGDSKRNKKNKGAPPQDNRRPPREEYYEDDRDRPYRQNHPSPPRGNGGKRNRY